MAFFSVQAAASGAVESEQIRIKAVSILFPLSFLGMYPSKGRTNAAPDQAKQEASQFASFRFRTML
jgi:hypothetical protein